MAVFEFRMISAKRSETLCERSGFLLCGTLSRNDTFVSFFDVNLFLVYETRTCVYVYLRVLARKSMPFLSGSHARRHVGRTWCHIERESRYRYAMPATAGHSCACARKLRGPAKRWPYVLRTHLNTRTHVRTNARTRINKRYVRAFVSLPPDVAKHLWTIRQSRGISVRQF